MYSSTPRLFTLLSLVLILGIHGCGTTADSRNAAVEDRPSPRQVDVFFLTDRAPEPDGDVYFGAERGETSFGITRVGIPPGHRMGRQEEPSLLKFEWSPNEHKHIKVQDVLPLTQDEFSRRIARAVADSPGRKIMVFVHGYNVRFTEATRLLAQFAHDLKFDGPAVLFSWPSQGSLTGYVVDETNAEWSQAHFTRFLASLLDEIPAVNIYLFGHSLGNRIIGRSVHALSSDRPASHLAAFREIIMIAPDIDADVFREDMAPRLVRTGIRLTVYASSKDRALMASKAFHGYKRAGDAGDGLLVVEGVETVDASDASGGLLGHSYFAEDRRIMEDIFAVLQTGQRAENRFGLEAVDTEYGRYWTFRK